MIAWSILSILVATASARYEPLIVTGGAIMVTAGIAGFAITIPMGSIPGILLCALLQGGGFGILWPFASRRIIEAAPDGERDIAASAFSTLQRLGYAIGAALTGIIANASGFSAGFTKEAAAGAAAVLFWPYLPRQSSVASLRSGSRAETVGDGLGFVLILPLLQNTFAMVNTSETVCRQYERTAALA